MKITWFFVLLMFTPLLAIATTPHKWNFEGKLLISISDADMVASAYVNGLLGEREGSDKLSIVSLNKGLPSSYHVTEVDASNSVAGPPLAVDADSQGRYVYVIETFTPRPNNGENHTFNDLKLGPVNTDLFTPVVRLKRLV